MPFVGRGIVEPKGVRALAARGVSPHATAIAELADCDAHSPIIFTSTRLRRRPSNSA